jgi:hypothetical protein
VAKAYAEAMEVLEMPRSSPIGPTKTLKVCDWPGPLAKNQDHPAVKEHVVDTQEYGVPQPAHRQVAVLDRRKPSAAVTTGRRTVLRVPGGTTSQAGSTR